jgi:hypothetical protein
MGKIVPLPQQFMLKWMRLSVSVVLIAVISNCAEAVQVTDIGNLVDPIRSGGGVSAWSPDGKSIMLAELHKDGLIHLCIYGIPERKIDKCIYSLKADRDLGIHAINWSDDYIHVAAGFPEGQTVVHRLPIPDWRNPSFRERNIADYKPLPGTYGYPVWDKWARGLFIVGEDERTGIRFISPGGKSTLYTLGAAPAVTRHYLWFTCVDNELMLGGICRIEKSNQKLRKLTDGQLDVSVSPKSDETGAIFIRKEHGTNKSSLYVYSDKGGIVGPVLSADHEEFEEFISVELSPHGDKAILAVARPDERDELNVILDVKIILIHW